MNTHALMITKQDGNLIGDCFACEWVCESVGVDASSRRHVEAAFDRHEEVAG